MKPRPILVLNPRSDRSFVTYVDHVSREELTTAAALQARLREQFPRAVVHARGLSGEDVTMWYVYRDGHWTRDEPLTGRSPDEVPDEVTDLSADPGPDEAEEGNGVRAGGRSPGDL